MKYNMSLSALLMAATCCLLMLCYLCWKRRELPIAVSYGLGMLAGAFYTLGYAYEIISPTLEQIRFWLRVEYVGIPFASTVWIIMVLQYTGRQALVRKPIIALLMIVPIITIIAHNTNEWHHLYYRSLSIDVSEGFPLVTLVVGPFYMFHVVYSYLFFIIGMGLLIQKYRRSSVRMKKQVMLMMIGSLGPYGFAIIYLSGMFNLAIDISPFGFVFSGIFYMWEIYQFNMLRLAPLALEKVFESMQDAVILIDLDNKITGYNQSANEFMARINEKAAVGQPVTEIFMSYPHIVDIVTQKVSINERLKISRDNEDRFYNIYLTPIIDHKQKKVGKMVMLNDVTEAVNYEATLLEKSQQLAELNTFKDKMFNVIAHDIRDPLAVQVNLMELMEEEMQTCGGTHDEIIHEMGLQIQSSYTLVESLLDWFQNQRGGMVFSPVIRDLASVVRTNMDMMQVRSDGKRIKIISNILDNVLVFADKEMLDLIIRNLLSNAIKFTNNEGQIRIEAIHADGKVIVSVSDTGSGISEDQAETLLQEAYPISSLGTAGERGVGLGLTLCREFVQLNGGEIWFDSELGQGTTFYFSIPTPPS
ncbi:sensor histidine kinase [Cohnella abietis]|uniref:histidine kinase n=1 Tax=Cohnella abietis TaxID=2507935 RepID=A0A3T1DEU5_9BACL|nr:histidine kinase N-terminal 7TM domain-containing protein [Cohnella abietis]BBI36650.1 two-component sensor histidine kinase [Cohnella abietis]